MSGAGFTAGAGAGTAAGRVGGTDAPADGPQPGRIRARAAAANLMPQTLSRTARKCGLWAPWRGGPRIRPVRAPLVLLCAVLGAGCGGPSDEERKQLRLATLYGELRTLQSSVEFDEQMAKRMSELAQTGPDARTFALGMEEMTRRSLEWTARKRLEVQTRIDALERELAD